MTQMNNAKYKPKPKPIWLGEIRKCSVCDIEFTTKAWNQINCSRLCTKRKYEISYEHKTPIFFNESPYKKLLKTRIMVLNRDEFTCQYCGRSRKEDKSVVLHIDHMIPKAKGGDDSYSNLITSCQECNLGKSDTLLENWNKKNEARPRMV